MRCDCIYSNKTAVNVYDNGHHRRLDKSIFYEADNENETITHPLCECGVLLVCGFVGFKSESE